eukprot:654708-Pyramimonas_sp.AAC.5
MARCQGPRVGLRLRAKRAGSRFERRLLCGRGRLARRQAGAGVRGGCGGTIAIVGQRAALETWGKRVGERVQCGERAQGCRWASAKAGGRARNARDSRAACARAAPMRIARMGRVGTG